MYIATRQVKLPCEERIRPLGIWSPTEIGAVQVYMPSWSMHGAGRRPLS